MELQTLSGVFRQHMPQSDAVEAQHLLSSHDEDMEDQKDPADVASTPTFDDDVAAPPVLKGAIDPVYEAKAQTLNAAIQDIGRSR